MNTLKLFTLIIFLSQFGLFSFSQAIPNIVPNDGCDDDEFNHIYRKIKLYPTTIDPYNLPKPCINYGDYLDNSNFDLVFEDDFVGPLTTEKWVPEFAQRSIKFNSEINPFSGGVYPKRPLQIDFFNGFGALPSNFDQSVSGYIKLITKPVPEFTDNVFTYNQTGCSAPDPGDCILSDGFQNRRRFKYTSGWLKTQRNFKYGYFEINCKLPDFEGIWPAFWLFHLNGGNRTEIDIFEFAQKEQHDPVFCAPEDITLANRRMFNTYWDWQGLSATLDDPPACYSVDALSVNAIGETLFNYTNTWHTYALYWDEFKIVWIFDGHPFYSTYQYLWQKKNILGHVVESGVISNCSELGTQAGIEDHEILQNFYWPDEQCKLIIGSGVKNFGGAYNPNPDLDQTCSTITNPTSIEIDYVRVYGIRACDNTGTVYFCSDDPDNVQSYITASDNLWIAPTCNVTIKNPEPEVLPNNESSHYVDAVAGNEITISPGFEAQAGSVFDARIEPCETADLRSTTTGNNILTSQAIKEQIKAADKMANDKLQQSIQAISPSVTFNVYPNPTSGIIEFNVSESMKSMVLLDVTGSVVTDLSSQIKSGRQQVNLIGFSKGVYVIKVTTESGTYLSNKIILN